jgi:hypothetical protein
MAPPEIAGNKKPDIIIGLGLARQAGNLFAATQGTPWGFACR